MLSIDVIINSRPGIIRLDQANAQFVFDFVILTRADALIASNSLFSISASLLNSVAQFFFVLIFLVTTFLNIDPMTLKFYFKCSSNIGRGRDSGYRCSVRTDPYVQHYRIRLLPQVMTPKRATGKGYFGTCLGKGR